MSMILNFGPGFHETGKIKIGVHGEARTSKSGGTYHLPQKLDHFLITTCEKDKDGVNFTVDPIMQKLGPKPRELAIRLIFDPLEDNFDTSYSFYSGHKCLCRGNGETATRKKYVKDGNAIKLTGEQEQVKCPCELLDPTEDGKGRCKPYGILMCVLEHSEKVGGVYKFRTTSYNTIRGIMTALAFIRQASGGILSGLPLWMTISPKQVEIPGGKKSLVHVVNVEYRGSLDKLIAEGARVATVRSQSQIAMSEVRKSLRLLTMIDTPEDEAAVNEEFHPETAGEKVIDADFNRVDQPAPETAGEPQTGPSRQASPLHGQNIESQDQLELDDVLPLGDDVADQAPPPKPKEKPAAPPPKPKAQPVQAPRRAPDQSGSKSANDW